MSRRLPILLLGLSLVGLGVRAPSVAADPGGVAGTLHNLSVSGPGEFRAVGETEVCKFCHIPHNAAVPSPLWSRVLPEAPSYAMPASAPGEMAYPQPSGSSRLCLSCHDGTIALGSLVSGEVPMSGRQRLAPGDEGFLGTDLSGSHPISMTIADRTGLAEPGEADMGLRPLASIVADGDVRLDSHGRMQCTTCHDPHSDAYYLEGRVPHFWVKPTVEGVCLTCHELR